MTTTTTDHRMQENDLYDHNHPLHARSATIPLPITTVKKITPPTTYAKIRIEGNNNPPTWKQEPGANRGVLNTPKSMIQQ